VKVHSIRPAKPQDPVFDRFIIDLDCPVPEAFWSMPPEEQAKLIGLNWKTPDPARLVFRKAGNEIELICPYPEGMAQPKDGLTRLPQQSSDLLLSIDPDEMHRLLPEDTNRFIVDIFWAENFAQYKMREAINHVDIGKGESRVVKCLVSVKDGMITGIEEIKQ